ncbi:hypothetical protein D018_1596A, partial [Vibrio parahaemolyticus VP2007-007]
MHIST